jgi:hypothetical protein
MKLSLVPTRQQMADFAERQQTKCTPFSENTGLLLRQYSHLSFIGIPPNFIEILVNLHRPESPITAKTLISASALRLGAL